MKLPAKFKKESEKMARIEKAMAEGFGNGALWPLLDDLVSDLNDIRNLINEIRRELNIVTTLANEIGIDFNAHTHRADGAQAGQYNTSLAQSDVQTVAPLTASPIASPFGALVTAPIVVLRTIR